jgi:INO80 complex subunit C
LAEQLSYLHAPRPFKNPNYVKNINRRTKNLKTVLSQERERERLVREQRKQERLQNMDVDGQDAPEEDIPTCLFSIFPLLG